MIKRWKAREQKRGYYATLLRVVLLLVLLTAVLATGVATLLFSRYISEQTLRMSRQVLTQTAHTLDVQFRSVDDILYGIANTPSVTRRVQQRGTTQEHVRSVIDLRSLILMGLSNSGVLSRIFLYLPEENLILQYGSMDADDYIRFRITGEYGEAVDEFRKRLFATRRREMIRYTPPANDAALPETLLSVMPLPLAGTSPKGYLCAVFNVEALRTMGMSATLAEDSAYDLYILQGKEVLLSSGRSPEMDAAVSAWAESGVQDGPVTLLGFHYDAVTQEASTSGLRYVYFNNETLLKAQTLRVVVIALGVCGFVAVLAAFVSLRLTRRLYQPVQMLINMLIARGRIAPGRHVDDMLAIGRVIDTVLLDNSAMKRTIMQLQPLMDEAAFRRIIHLQDASESVRWLDSMMGGQLCMIMLRISHQATVMRQYTPRAANDIHLQMTVEWRKRLSSRVQVQTVRDGRNLCAVLGHEVEPTHLRSMLAETMRAFEADTLQQWGFKLVYAVSASVPVPEDTQDRMRMLRMLYDQCTLMLEQAYLRNQSDGGCWDTPMDEGASSPILLTLDTQKEIAALLQVGSEQAWQIALAMIEMNICDGAASYAAIRQMLAELLLLAYRTVAHSEEDTELVLGPQQEALSDMLSCDTLEESLSYLREAYEGACGHFAHRGRTLPFDRADLAQYVTANAGQDVSVSDAAAYFGLSPGYFAKLCKQMLGESFLDFLNRERIAHAQRLMGEGKLSILDISSAVGYTNYKTFARYFKKYTALAPSAYKERT